MILVFKVPKNGKYIVFTAGISLKVGAQFRNDNIGVNKGNRTQKLCAGVLPVLFHAPANFGMGLTKDAIIRQLALLHFEPIGVF